MDGRMNGDRLVQLRAMLKARDGKQEYRNNVKAIRAEISRLESLENSGGR